MFTVTATMLERCGGHHAGLLNTWVVDRDRNGDFNGANEALDRRPGVERPATPCSTTERACPSRFPTAWRKRTNVPFLQAVGDLAAAASFGSLNTVSPTFNAWSAIQCSLGVEIAVAVPVDPDIEQPGVVAASARHRGGDRERRTAPDEEVRGERHTAAALIATGERVLQRAGLSVHRVAQPEHAGCDVRAAVVLEGRIGPRRETPGGVIGESGASP